MTSDRGIIEENTCLLLARWRTVGNERTDHGGLSIEAANELRGFNEVQVKRAADVLFPLFGLQGCEDAVIRALNVDLERDSPYTGRTGDHLVEEENNYLLLNRWSSCKTSEVYAQSVLGMSERLISYLRQATLADLKKVASMGLRLGSMVTRPAYLFHSGRNVSLQRSQRTALAICCSGSTVL